MVNFKFGIIHFTPSRRICEYERLTRNAGTEAFIGLLAISRRPDETQTRPAGRRTEGEVFDFSRRYGS